MNSSSITRTLADNRVVEVRPCEGAYAAWVRCGRWSAWRGGFRSANAALAWGEAQSADDVVDVDESLIGGQP